MQVVADDAPLLPLPTRHAGVKVATEEVEALFALPEVDHSGLVRVQAQTKLTQDGGRPPLGRLGLCLGLAQHHEVVRVADNFSGATLRPGPVEGVQVDVGQQRGDDPALGVPVTVSVTTPSTSTPARNHCRNSLSTRRSDTRSPTSESNFSWSISPKKF